MKRLTFALLTILVMVGCNDQARLKTEAEYFSDEKAFDTRHLEVTGSTPEDEFAHLVAKNAFESQTDTQHPLSAAELEHVREGVEFDIAQKAAIAAPAFR